MQTHKILSIICYFVLPLSLILISIRFPYPQTFRLYGKAAEILLIYILFLKPVGIMFNISWLRKQIALRRQLGVAVFWLALFHSIMHLYDRDLYSLTNYFGFNNYLAYGLIAMIGMGILALTSNNLSTRYLTRNWKKIQYLAYPTLLFTLLHSSMANSEIEKFLFITATYLILKTLEWKKISFRD